PRCDPRLRPRPGRGGAVLRADDRGGGCRGPGAAGAGLPAGCRGARIRLVHPRSAGRRQGLDGTHAGAGRHPAQGDGRATRAEALMRIVAGTAGGRRLRVPSRGTRPTSERVREALFSRLEHLGYLDSTLVLDLYAGSGALGLEAVSRGAAQAVLVESARPAVATCRANIATAGLGDRVQVRNTTVAHYLAGPPPPEPFDVVLCDPPYAAAVREDLEALARPGWLAADAMVVLERDQRSDAPQWPAGWEPLGARRYGETTIHSARIP